MYPRTDVFLVVFSLTDDESFHNVKSKWIKEIVSAVPEAEAVILLVGTKADLVTDSKSLQERSSAARSLAREINACSYLETSSKEMKGINEVIEAACKIKKG